MKYWETKDGRELSYREIGDNHLLNILSYIKKKSIEGVTVYISYGYGDNDYQEGDTYEIYGNTVLNAYNFKAILREAKKRKLI